MLTLPIQSLFLRAIPEGILLIFSNYVIVKKDLEIKKIFLSGILLGVSDYLIRLLPVYFGIHTIFCLIIYICLSIKINKIEIFTAIRASILNGSSLCILDLFIAVTYIKLLNMSLNSFFKEPFIALLFGIPSLISFLVIYLILYIKNYRNSYLKKI